MPRSIRSLELESLRAQRDGLRYRHNRRVKKARKEGRILVTGMETEKALHEITTLIRKLQSLFQRVRHLELVEEDVLGDGKGMSGRNRLSLRYGKE